MYYFASFAGFCCFPVWSCSMISISANIPSRLRCSGVIPFARSFQCKEVPVLVSLIAPAYNEEGNIMPFARSVASAFRDLAGACELVFVDDGSSDNTLSAMRSVFDDSHIKESGLIVRVVEFSRNFGKEAALYAGLEHSSGDICVLIDTDMQQPPAIARQMVDILLDDNQGRFDCVAAYQEQRKRGKLRNWCSSAFYRVLGASSGMDVLADASDFRAFRANVRNALLGMTEYFRFSKGLFSWIGFKTKPFPYVPNERLTGETTWSFWKLAKYAINGLMSFSTFPLRIATWLGAGASALAIIYMAIVISQRLLFGVDVPGYATIVSLVLLLGGVTAACSWRYGRVSLESVYARKESSNLYKAFL